MGKGDWVKVILDSQEEGAKLFYKEVLGGQQFDRQVYFKRGPLAKLCSRVKQYM